MTPTLLDPEASALAVQLLAGLACVAYVVAGLLELVLRDDD